MKQLLPIFLFFCWAAEMPAQEYRRIREPEKLDGQQAYILPKTAFLIEVPYIKTTLSRGDHFKDYDPAELKAYKEKYGLDVKKYNNVKDGKNLTAYKIIEDSIKINIRSVPDYSKIFYVDPAKGWNKSQTVSFTYGSDGLLSEGESSLENKTFDIVIKGLSGVASIAGSFFTGRGVLPVRQTEPDYEIEDLNKALDKYDILTIQTNYDIYKDLKAKYEKEYNKLFSDYFYIEKKEAHTLKFLYIPKAQKPSEISDATQVPLFRFNEDDGRITFSAGLENQIVVKTRDFGPTSEKSYVLVFEKQVEQQSAHYNERNDEHRGFAFNIPLSVQLKMKSIQTEGKVLYYEAAKIPQYGIVGYSKAKNKKLSFQLDPLTGELKKLTIEGKAVTSDQAGTVAPVIVDAVKLAKGESAATKLDNEVKELENMKKKRDLIKELELQ